MNHETHKSERLIELEVILDAGRPPINSQPGGIDPIYEAYCDELQSLEGQAIFCEQHVFDRNNYDRAEKERAERASYTDCPWF